MTRARRCVMECLRKRRWRCAPAAVVVALLTLCAGAAQARPALRLNSAYVDTTAPGAWGLPPMLPQPAGKTAVRRIVQLVGPLTPDRARALAAAGIEIEDYLPDDAFIVRVRGGWTGAVGLPFVRWVGVHRPEWKIDPLLGVRPHAEAARREMAARGEHLLDITLYKGVDPRLVAGEISRVAGAPVAILTSPGDHATLRVATRLRSAFALGRLPSVLYVQETPEVALRDLTQKAIVQSATTTATPVHNHGVTGAGQILGQLDSHVDPNHCAFAGKILQYNTALGADFHGTLVADVALGDAGADDDLRGVAYGAKLVYNLVPSTATTPGPTEDADLLSRFTLHHNQGARVHTNSWGWDGDTTYNGWARAIDEFTWSNEDDVVVFAITNLSTLRTPENAKNALAVGASGDNGGINSIGSGGRGPTSDGRRKPEVFAPGVGIAGASALGPCAVTSGTGTSFAAPAIAGAVMLARQYFMDGFYPSGAATPADAFTPTAALLRAAIINASSNMTGAPISGDTYPSNEEGWGLTALDRSLFFTGDARTLLVDDIRKADSAALTTGGVWTRMIRVLSATEQLRVTLSWTEPPATLGAAFAPVNNLNLEVVSPSGVVYKGNNFDTLARQSAPGGVFDDRNNLEQTHISSPEVGDWRVTVTGQAVNVGPQGFAVLTTGAVGPVPPCPADLDGDRMVGPADLLALLGNFGGVGIGDITGDGVVGPDDLLALLAAFGACP